MKKNLILTLLATILVAGQAFAGPARPGTFIHRQSDGSLITLQIYGDEYYHYTLMDNTYTVMQNASNDYCFATIENGRMVPSDVLAVPAAKLNNDQRKAAMRSVGLRPTHTPNRNVPTFNELVRTNAAEMQRATVNADGSVADVFQIGGWGHKREGKLNALVVLVEYSDVKFTIPNPRQQFTDMLTKSNYSDYGGTGCANDYYKDNSNGKFEVDFTVVGPYTLDNERAYYGGNDANGNDQRPGYMAVQACQMAYAAGDLTNFAQFDNDGDNFIDMVFVFYAGNNEAEGGPQDSVWPHKSVVGVYPFGDKTVAGVGISVYACTSELRGTSATDMSGIGSFCHEFGHVLGLPDFYDTNYDTDGKPASPGLSYTSIMSSGNYMNDGCTPPAYSILERWFLGWAKPTELTEPGHHTLGSLYDDEGLILFSPTDKGEFFLFENRNKKAASSTDNTSSGKSSVWDEYMLAGCQRPEGTFAGGEGMLVYHIDARNNTANIWAKNQPNADPDHMCARMLKAVASDAIDASSMWFFPGSRNVTTLTDKTTPALLTWDNERLPFNFSEITLDNGNVTFNATEVVLTVDTRQYDSLISWSGSKHVGIYDQWQVICTSLEGGEPLQFTTSDTSLLIAPLTPSTSYLVHICGLEGSTPTEPLHSLEITTQANARSPRSALDMEQYEYNSITRVRLGVKNLDMEPEQIQWYVDGELTTNLYTTFSVGEHLICAVITDAEGNTEYLYRYINVTK